MTLLEILVRELPKHGGWPDGAVFVAQEEGGELWSFTSKPQKDCDDEWMDESHGGYHTKVGKLREASDHDISTITREQYEAALAEAGPEWNGEGLPPVGCECQYRKHKKTEHSEWFNGVVKYASEFTVVIQPVCYAGETIGHPDNFEFRTIPSEDDIKRDASIKAIFDVLAQYDSLKGCHTYEGKADYLYSAIASEKIPHIRID